MPATLARPPRTPPSTLARTATAGAAVLLPGSAALYASRFVPARLVPVQPDTWAMVTAFTDLAAPGCLLATVAAAVGLALRRRRARLVLVGLCLATTCVQALVLAPRWVAAPPPDAHGSFTLLALNARLGHADPAAVARVARTADLVVLTEVTAPQLDALVAEGLTEQLPYRSTGRLPSRGGAGTTVLSRYPLTGTEALSPDIENQSWVCRVGLPGLSRPLTVIAVHPARPRVGGRLWAPEQAALRAALPTTGPRVLAGDFNAVASHPTQRALVRDGWRSAVDEAGAGWVPTYPADSSRVPPLIDIDHVLVAGSLQATSIRSVAVPGTDHLGLLATVALTGT